MNKSLFLNELVNGKCSACKKSSVNSLFCAKFINNSKNEKIERHQQKND